MAKKKSITNKAIENRYQAFVEEYVKYFNATRAYLEVYGGTERTAESNGCKLLRNTKVKEILKAKLKERAEEARLDASYIVDFLKGAIDLDLDKLAEIGSKGVTLKDFKDIPKSVKRYVTSVKVTQSQFGTVVNFKVYSKEHAINILAKHAGVDNTVITHQVNIRSFTDLVNKHNK